MELQLRNDILHLMDELFDQDRALLVGMVKKDHAIRYQLKRESANLKIILQEYKSIMEIAGKWSESILSKLTKNLVVNQVSMFQHPSNYSNRSAAYNLDELLRNEGRYQVFSSETGYDHQMNMQGNMIMQQKANIADSHMLGSFRNDIIIRM